MRSDTLFPIHRSAARRISLPVLAVVLGLVPAVLAGDDDPSGLLAGPESPCDRGAGTLSRYLLCLELEARRPSEAHALYYDELEQIEAGLVDQLPKRRRDVLPWLYHGGRGGTIYMSRLTLIDTLDWRRADPQHRLAADCDILSLINAGVAERYYRETRGELGVHLVRTSHDHVVNLATRRGRPAGVLETVDGTLRRGLLPGWGADGPFRPMTESEVVALYLAHVGLAFAREGRHRESLDLADRALRLDPGEFVAWAGRALALLLRVAAEPGDPGSAPPWCAGAAARPLLDQAERAASRARSIAPDATSPYSLLGKIKLQACEPERARPYLEQAVEHSADPLDLYYLGLILHEEGHYREAIRRVRDGLRRVVADADRRHVALRYEMEFLLAHAHTERAELEDSAGQLRRAMRHLAAVEREFPEDGTVLGLRRAVERLDRRIGPVRRELGLPFGLGLSLYNASIEE